MNGQQLIGCSRGRNAVVWIKTMQRYFLCSFIKQICARKVLRYYQRDARRGDGHALAAALEEW